MKISVPCRPSSLGACCRVQRPFSRFDAAWAIFITVLLVVFPGLAGAQTYQNTQYSFTTRSGGAIISAAQVSASASVGDLLGVMFSANTVSITNNYLFGGGLAGAAVSQGAGAASVGMISGTFDSNTTHARTAIEGGGLVGARAGGTGNAMIGESAASFQGNTVQTTFGYLQGGGLVGARSYAGNAMVGTISGSFGTAGRGNAVTLEASLQGGGLVGAKASAGNATVSGISRTATFYGNTVAAGVGTNGEKYLLGGGLVGASSNLGTARVGDSFGAAGGNTVTTGSYLYGGGLVGARSSSGNAVVGTVSGSFGGPGNENTTSGNMVRAGTWLYGGGLVGAMTDFGTATVHAIASETTFQGNTVATGAGGSGNQQLFGGGLVGAYSYGNTANVGDVAGTFGGTETRAGNTVTVGTSLLGGGLVGAATYTGQGTAFVGTVSAAITGNTVNIGSDLYGGGMIGAWSQTRAAAFGGLDGAILSSNTVTAGATFAAHNIGGGIIGVSGLNNTLTVNDSILTGNHYTVTAAAGAAAGGMIYIGTDRDSAGNAVLLTASGGKTTEISGNIYTVNGVSAANSFHFGRSWNPLASAVSNSLSDAFLTVRPEAEGTIHLLDPITVDMNAGRSFTMTIEAGAGSFTWDGLNRLSVTDGGAATVTFATGATTLGRDFSLKAENSTALHVTFSAGSTVVMEITGRDADRALFDYTSAAGGSTFAVASGATLAASGLPSRDSLTPEKSRSFIAFTLASGISAADITTAISNFTVDTTGSVPATLAQSGSNLQYVVDYTAANTTLTWTSSDDGTTWDELGKANWTGTLGNQAVTKFMTGDTVIFDDTAPGKSIRVADGGVWVAGMTVSNSTGNDYVFSGGEIVSETGAFAKTGDGAVTFANGVKFASASVSGGTLRIGNGDTTGSMAIAGDASFSNAVIDLGALNPATMASASTITVGGAVSFTNTTVTVDAESAVSGAYLLIDYGTLVSETGVTVTVLNLGDNRGGEYYFDTDNTRLMYAIIADNTLLTWKGTAAASTWNTETANTNWTTGSFDTYFTTGDTVIFDNTAVSKAVRVADGGVAVAGMTVNNTAGNNYTFSGGSITSTSGTLEKTGAGAVIFTNAATFGSATVSEGVLQIGDGGTTGSFIGDIQNNASLIFNRSNAYDYIGAISGSGTFTKTGTSELTMSSSAVQSAFNLNQGALNLSSGVNLTGNLTVAQGAMLRVSSSTITGSTTFSDDSAIEVNLSSAAAGTPALTLTGGTLTAAYFSLNVTYSALADGTYTVISAGNFDFDGTTFTRTINGQTPGGMGGPNIRYGMTDFDTATLGRLNLTLAGVDGVRTATWTGTNSMTWNETDENWTLSGESQHKVFKKGDDVVFGDTGVGTVTIINGTNGDITIGNMTIESATGEYFFTGQNIESAGAFTKTGDGAVGFDNAINFASANISGGAVSFANNATFASANISGSAVWVGTTGSLEITGNATFSNVTLDLGTLDSTAFVSSGTITVGGAASFTTTTVVVDAINATVGTYTLITYDSIAPSANTITVDALNLDTSLFTVSYLLEDTKLTYTLADPLIWNGTTGPSTWNTEPTNTNWLDGGGAATSFENNKTVLFNDTATNKNVAVHTGGVTVSGMRVNNSLGNNYTFSDGTITGTGAFTKTGDGAVTFANVVEFASASVSGGPFKIETTGMFTVTGDATFTNNSPTVVGSDAYGGAIYNTGTVGSGGVSFSGLATFTGNAITATGSTAYGGAIYNVGWVFFSDTATFAGNTATGSDAYGGAIYNYDHGTVKFSGLGGPATFTDNTATGSSAYGGAIYNGGDSGVYFSGPAIFENNTAGSGGAIYNSGDSGVYFSGPATFTNNTANSAGGAIYNASYATVTFSGPVTFENNSAVDSGGGVSNWNGTVTFSDAATFTTNVAGNRGGGIFNSDNTVTFFGPATFTSNTAGGNGGGIYTSGEVTFSGPATFENNTADRGGAIYNAYGGTVNLRPTHAADTILFSGNTTNSVPNSIYVNNSCTLNVGGAGIIDMRDPMAASTGVAVTISKSGDSTWYLGGANRVVGATAFTVSGGTLHLYRAGEVNNPGYADGKVDTGTISLEGAGSSFTLGSGATLSMGGTGHSISVPSGTITLAAGSTLAFDLAHHSTTGSMLTLTGSTTVGDVNVDLLSLNSAGPYTLVSGADFSSISTALTFQGENLADTLLAGTITLVPSTSDLTITVGSPPATANLTWVGENGGVWNLASTNNWSERSASETRFLPGDTVTFDDTAVYKMVTVNAGGVTVAGMTVNNATGNDYTFTGGAITGTGALTKTDNGAVTFANAVKFASASVSGGTLKIADTGKLSVTGNASFANTTIDLGLLTSANTITVGGTASFGENVKITLDLAGATAGTYTLITYGSVDSASTITAAVSNIGPNLAGTLKLTGTALTYTLSNTPIGGGYSPLLAVNGWMVNGTTDTAESDDEAPTVTNETRTWTGAENGNWDTTTANWSGDGSLFVAGDKVTFDSTASTTTITVASEGVAVSAMTVSGGTYAFNGGAITSTDETTLDNPTQQLIVTGSKTMASFGTALNFAGGIAVTDGATLGGNFTATGGITVGAGSVISPGNSINTITTDRITFETGSVYRVEVDPTDTASSDRIVVTSTATLAGTVQHTGLSETAARLYGPTGTWTILSAGEIVGTFDAVTSNFAFLDASLLYEENEVRLQLSRNDLPFAQFATTSNQREVATGLDTVGQTGTGAAMGVYNTVLAMNSNANLPFVFDMLSGEIHAGLAGGLMEADRRFGERQRARLSGKDADQSMEMAPGTVLWFSADRQKSTADKTDNTGEGEFSTWGASLGVDKKVSDWTLGAAFRYGDGEYKVNDRSSEAEIDSFSLALYAGRPLGGDFNLKLGAGYGLHQVDSKRQVAFMTQQLKGDYDVHTVQAFGEVGWLKTFADFSLEPYAGFSWNFSRNESFSETGGSAALRADAEEHDNFASNLGVRGRYRLVDEIVIGASLDYQHLFGSTTPESRFAFDGGQGFTIDGAPMDRNSIGAGVDVGLKMEDFLFIKAGYLGRFGEDTDSHAGYVNVEISF